MEIRSKLYVNEIISGYRVIIGANNNQLENRIEKGQRRSTLIRRECNEKKANECDKRKLHSVLMLEFQLPYTLRNRFPVKLFFFGR